MSKKKNDWKNREGIVYSTSPGFDYSYPPAEERETVPGKQQNLKVALDKSGRAGKQVTIVSGFVGKVADLDQLARRLKQKCGAGGSCKDYEILIQGDVRDKVAQFLLNEGYRVKRVG
jgi:translation initiation factor 1